MSTSARIKILPTIALFNKPLRFSPLLSAQYASINHIFQSVRLNNVIVSTDYTPYPIIISEKVIDPNSQVRSTYLSWLWNQISFLSLSRKDDGRLFIEGIPTSTMTSKTTPTHKTTFIEISSFADLLYAHFLTDPLFEEKGVTALVMTLAPRILSRLNRDYLLSSRETL